MNSYISQLGLVVPSLATCISLFFYEEHKRIVCSVFLMMYLYTDELHTICKLWNSFFTVQNLQITKTSTYTKQSLHRCDVRGDAMAPERVLARNSNYVEKKGNILVLRIFFFAKIIFSVKIDIYNHYSREFQNLLSCLLGPFFSY